jgi:hypothetical protein
MLTPIDNASASANGRRDANNNGQCQHQCQWTTPTPMDDANANTNGQR